MGESIATTRSDHDSGDGVLDLDFAAGLPESPSGGAVARGSPPAAVGGAA